MILFTSLKTFLKVFELVKNLKVISLQNSKTDWTTKNYLELGILEHFYDEQKDASILQTRQPNKDIAKPPTSN